MGLQYMLPGGVQPDQLQLLWRQLRRMSPL
jgi:hypothetical protein